MALYSVVAIHGLETTSEKTWTFDSRNSENEINWLEDDSMLAKALEEADIWTYDWPADTFQDNPVQGALQDRAKSFLDHLYTQLSKDKPSPVELDQIIFIASCFGGLLLADVPDSPLESLHRSHINRANLGNIPSKHFK
jgi:hypothetical protein